MEEFNKKCFNFQNKILEIFNDESIPFLLKYYLLKDIWESVQRKKIEMEIQTVRNQQNTNKEEINNI